MTDDLHQPQPYDDAARGYHRLGWSPLPLPARCKKSPPPGWTGNGAPYPSAADVEAWCEDQPGGNVGLRLAPHGIGIDVDNYGTKPGAETLAAAEARLGPCRAP